MSEEKGPNSKNAGNTTQWKQLLAAKAAQVGERLGRASFDKLPAALTEGIRDLAVGIEVGIIQESQARATENLNALTARADGIQQRMDIRADAQDRAIDTKLTTVENKLKAQVDANAKALKDQAATDYGVLRAESKKARESAGAANTSAMAADSRAGNAEAAAKKAAETVDSFTSQIAALEDVDDDSKPVRGASALGVIAARVRAVQRRLSDIDTIFESLAPLMRAWKDGIVIDGRKMDFVEALNHVLSNSAKAAKSAAESAESAKDARTFLLDIQHNLVDGVDTANKKIAEVADTVLRLSMAPPPLSAAPASSPVSSPPSSGVKGSALESGSAPAKSDRPPTPAPAAPSDKKDTPAPETSASPIDSWSAPPLQIIAAETGLPATGSAAPLIGSVPSNTKTMVPVSGIPPADTALQFPAPPKNPTEFQGKQHPVSCPPPIASVRAHDLPSPPPGPVTAESAGESKEAGEVAAAEEKAKPLSIQESAKQRFDAADSTIAAVIDMARKKGKIDDAYESAVAALVEELKVPSMSIDESISNGVFDARVQAAFHELDGRARTLAILLDVDEALQEQMHRSSYTDSEPDQERRIDGAFERFTNKLSKLWDLNSFEREPLSMSSMRAPNGDSKDTGGVS